MSQLTVSKWQGTGNDFVLLDNPTARAFPYDRLARALCDRRLGVGGDGLIVMLPATGGQADVAMRTFNADGSEAEMCGNGIRCVALARAGRAGRSAVSIETMAGPVRAEILSDGRVRVDMGAPRLTRGEIPMSGPEDAKAIGAPVELAGEVVRLNAISMGNPHCVVFVEGALDRIDLRALAATLNDESLFPHGANVEIANGGGSRFDMRVWERGVGETQACGSGACAVAVTALLAGRAASPLEVRMPGGSLVIEWRGEGEHVFLTGAASQTFRAEVDLPAALLDDGG